MNSHPSSQTPISVAPSRMSFDDVLERFDTQYGDNPTKKGPDFEELMLRFLVTYSVYKDKFKKVWLWRDFPYRKQISSGHDVGIDLVALTKEGGYWSVQCKCFGENTQVNKAHVSAFLSASLKRFIPEEEFTPEEESTSKKESQRVTFEHCIWIDTCKTWSLHAENAVKTISKPFTRLGYFELCDAKVDWEDLLEGKSGVVARLPPKGLWEHQKDAQKAVAEGFRTAERGKLIMACGTGKTLTSLHIAQESVEQNPEGSRMVLYLVPSLALMNQTLCEWADNCTLSMQAVCVCSDKEVSRRSNRAKNDEIQLSRENLALPAATDPDEIVRQWRMARTAASRKNSAGKKGMTVLFSTYQSIERVYEAQNKLLEVLKAEGRGEETATAAATFDLILCDEAHRTTGVKLPQGEEAPFTKVHDNAFLQARKRLYMTATPRLYTDASKAKAKLREVEVYSMDDERIYGREFYRLGFGEAVEKELLTDYKVLVLEANETKLSKEVQEFLKKNPEEGEEAAEIELDQVSKMVGCLNALSKIFVESSQDIVGEDPEPMRRSLTFCGNIKEAKRIATQFERISKYLDGKRKRKGSETAQKLVLLRSDYVTGAMSSPEREQKMRKLKEGFRGSRQSRMLCNVRCLSEGVDVPALDAVLFFSRRSSYVDVVQSVGRVMRKADGKKFGYIIIPVAISTDASPEEVLNKNREFDVVWEVLNALRAHDERFNAHINSIQYNTRRSNRIAFVPERGDVDYLSEAPGSQELSDENAALTGRQQQVQTTLELHVERAQECFYAKMVSKVGDRAYYEDWAEGVGRIAQKTTEAIRVQLASCSPESQEYKAFHCFLAGLYESINPSIREEEALNMLAQHIVSKPIFDSVVDGFDFAAQNSVSQSMDNILSLLGTQWSEEEEKIMKCFQEDVKRRFSGIDNAQGRQQVIKELYNRFFSAAFKRMSEKLGIVYTPVELVDFVNHSVADLLQQEFGRAIGDEGVQILDPFTGTGTFVARMLEDKALIPMERLPYKYRNEIHANEIVLLPYYIASVNIEQVYHERLQAAEIFNNVNGGGRNAIEMLSNCRMSRFRGSV